MNNKPNYSKGNRREIIYLLHNLGILPYPSIKMLSKSEGALNRTHQTIRKMIQEGVLDKRRMQATYGSQFLVMKDYENNKATLVSCIAKECQEYYAKHHKPKLYTTWIKNNAIGMRKINEAYLEAMMYGAGFDTFTDQNSRDNKYFNSREVKKWLNYNDDVKSISDGLRKVAFTKGYGIATTQGGNYIPYMTWHNTIPALSEGEHKYKNLAYEVVNQVSTNKQGIEGIVILNNLKSLCSYMDESSTTANHNRFLNMLNVYPSLYILPYSEYGRMQLEIMGMPLWKERLIQTALGEIQDTKYVNFSCHHYDKESKVGTLLFCIPDIGMLQNFYLTACSVNIREKFRIICFDYQKEFVMALAKDVCEIYSTPFKEYYNAIRKE